MTSIRTENPLSIEAIKESVSSTFKSITQDVFNKHAYDKSTRIVFIDGRKLRFESMASDLTILFNAAPPSANSTLDTSEQVVLDAVGIKSMMQGGHSSYQSFKDTNGIDLAYLDKKFNDLYIPYDMLDLGEATAFQFYENMLDMVIKDIKHKETQQYMWGGENHDAVFASLAELVKGQESTNISTIERNLRDSQENENNYRDRLRQEITRTRNFMQQLDSAREGGNKLDARIAKEFEIASKNPDVRYIEVRDGKFIIHTNEIMGYASNGKHYYFGSYRIEYTLGNTGVNYFGGTPRKGYWSEKDPHPHVDGRTGQPCLGNTAEAIAQLGSLHEYAALVTVAIEFLKAANVADSAGKKVVAWDEVDIATGEVVRKASHTRGEEMVECYETGDTFPMSEMVTAYGSADEDDMWDERYVHNENLSMNYTFHEEHNSYIHDSAEVWN